MLSNRGESRGGLWAGMDARTAQRRVRLLGGEVDLVAPDEMLKFVELMAAAGGPALIANHNAHSLFLIRRSPHLQDLVHQCAGVKGGSFLTVSYVDGSPLFYRRPGGGFYVVVMGMPYVIGFSDDGTTDFSWEKKPLAMFPEDRVVAAYKAMAEGKLAPQAAVDSLFAADPDRLPPRQ